MSDSEEPAAAGFSFSLLPSESTLPYLRKSISTTSSLVIGFDSMATPEEKTELSAAAGRKLWWLILGRLITALILFLLATLWNHGANSQQSLTKIFNVLSIVICLTIIYSLTQRFSETLFFQARLQFAVDVLLVTWLVWISDVTQSPYIALYIVIIAVSSLFLGPRDAVVVSVGCAVAFTVCALAVIFGFSRSASPGVFDNSISQTIQSVGVFDIAFFVVGLLSARLADTQSRSDVRLLAATQSLASLRVLHERIVESIRSGLVTTDLNGRIYTFNKAAEEITGHQAESVRGKDASIFFGEMKDHIADSVRASDTGEVSPRFETDCFTSEGRRLRLGFSIAPLFSESGETTGMVITFQDL